MVVKKNLPFGTIEYNKEKCIVYTRYNEGLIVNLDIARQVRKTIYQITGKDKFGIYSDMSGIIMLEHDARTYLGNDPEDRIVVSAVLVRNPLQKNFVNLFEKFAQKTFNFKSFTDDQKAYKWLEENLQSYCNKIANTKEKTYKNIQSKIEKDFASFEYKSEDCIVISRYKKDIVVTKQMAEEARNVIWEIAGKGKLGILTDFSQIILFQVDVKEVAIENPDNRIIAVAILVSDEIMENLINLYSKFETPSYKYSIFKNYDEAYQWLKDMTREFCR